VVNIIRTQTTPLKNETEMEKHDLTLVVTGENGHHRRNDNRTRDPMLAWSDDSPTIYDDEREGRGQFTPSKRDEANPKAIFFLMKP